MIVFIINEVGIGTILSYQLITQKKTLARARSSRFLESHLAPF